MANRSIKNGRLKRERKVISVAEMTQYSYYYGFAIPQTHDYLMAVIAGWGGSASPFTAMYDPLNEKAFFIFGATVPTHVYMDFFYYE